MVLSLELKPRQSGVMGQLSTLHWFCSWHMLSFTARLHSENQEWYLAVIFTLVQGVQKLWHQILITGLNPHLASNFINLNITCNITLSWLPYKKSAILSLGHWNCIQKLQPQILSQINCSYHSLSTDPFWNTYKLLLPVLVF